MLKTIAATLAVAIPAFAPALARADTTTGTVTSNGTEFPYILHTPVTYDPAKPVPLVVVVHGAQTTAEQERRGTGVGTPADDNGLAGLFPEGDATDPPAPPPPA